MFAHVLATIERGAVGNHALAINNELTSRNIEFTAYAETIRDEFTHTFCSMEDLSNHLSSRDSVLYQFANPSPIADVLYESGCRLILNYHNVTPAYFFSRWSPATASAVSRARAQLARLAPICHSAIAVSHFNAAELVRAGYRNITVIPPLFSSTFYELTSTTHMLNNSSKWLYVGRIAPHKNLHVLLRAFEYYRRYHDENATLTVVGSTDTPLYGHAINELIADRQLNDSVYIIQNATIDELLVQYQQSDIYVSASEHEGFCVPLVEAMSMGLPVVAVDAGAVSETTGSAGALVHSANSITIADTVAEILFNSEKRESLIAKGLERAQRYDPRISSERYGDYLLEVAS